MPPRSGAVELSREIDRNGGATAYRAMTADVAAVVRRRRPTPSKLAACPVLRRLIEDTLALQWSPGQIQGWLKAEHLFDPELWVSHETIYRSLFVQSKGALKRQLTAHLPSRRMVRQPGCRNRSRGTGKRQLTNTTPRPSRSGPRKPTIERSPDTGKVA